MCNFTTGKQHFVHIPFAELLFVCVSFSAGFIRSPFILSKNGWNYTESNVRCIEAPWSQFNFITFILFHFVDFFSRNFLFNLKSIFNIKPKKNNIQFTITILHQRKNKNVKKTNKIWVLTDLFMCIFQFVIIITIAKKA